MATIVAFALVVVAAIGGFAQGEAGATPPAPTVTALTPNSGPFAGGTSVTISGANLAGATGVAFGSANATSFSVSPSTYVADSFGRTVTTGWGTADTGGAWTLQKGGGTTGSESVANDTGAITTMPAFYTQDEQVLTTATNALDFGFSFDITWPQSVESMSSPTADYGGLLGGIVARFQSAQDEDDSYYKMSASWDSNGGSPQLELRAQSNGTVPAGGAFRLNDDTGIDPTADYPSGGPYAYQVAGEITGANPTSFAMSIWKLGTPQPASWMLTGTDTADAGPQVAGLVGFRGDDDLSNTGGSTFLSTPGTVDIGALSVTPLSTTVTAVSPSGSGTVDVLVTTTSGGTSAKVPADQFTYTSGPPPAPTVSGLSSSSGPAGTPVTITGTNLTGATAVDFGSTAAASYTVTGPTSITTTAPAAPSSPSASYSAVGSLVSGSGNGKASLAFTSKAAGDAIVLSIAIEADVTVTGVTTAGVTWQRLHTDQVDTSTSPNQVVSLWLGTVTTPGAMTITVAYSASVSATPIDIAAQEFSAGLGSTTIWSVGPAGAQNNAASTTIAFPSLTPSSGTALGVWWVDCANTASGTSSGTMHSTTDSVGDLFAYDTAVTGATAPSATQTSGFSVVMGALVTASAPATAVDVTVTTPNGTSAKVPADQFTYTSGPPPAPTVSGLSSSSGPVGGAPRSPSRAPTSCPGPRPSPSAARPPPG